MVRFLAYPPSLEELSCLQELGHDILWSLQERIALRELHGYQVLEKIKHPGRKPHCFLTFSGHHANILFVTLDSLFWRSTFNWKNKAGNYTQTLHKNVYSRNNKVISGV